MKPAILLSLIFSLLFADKIIAKNDEYFVSPHARELGISHVGNQLLRWVRFSSESKHPCLHVELLTPVSYMVNDQMQICALPDENNVMYDFIKDLSSIDLFNIKVNNMRLTFNADLILLKQGSKSLQCSLSIKEEKLNALSCVAR